MAGDHQPGGRLPAQRADQRVNPGPARVIAPGSPTIVRARLVIISGAGTIGVFVYDGTPGPGNPPIAWMTPNTVDPYGNPVSAGFGTTQGEISGSVFAGANFVLNSSGLFLYAPGH